MVAVQPLKSKNLEGETHPSTSMLKTTRDKATNQPTSKQYTRVDPSALTKDHKGPKYLYPRNRVSRNPNQVLNPEPRSVSPLTTPNLLAMVMENLQVAELPDDLKRTLQRKGDAMVRTYYAKKAEEVIRHDSARQDHQHDRNCREQCVESLVKGFIEEQVKEAVVMAREHLEKQKAEPQQAAKGQVSHGSRASHHSTLLTSSQSVRDDTQGPRAVNQRFSERPSGSLDRNLPTTEVKSHGKSGGTESANSQRATATSVTPITRGKTEQPVHNSDSATGAAEQNLRAPCPMAVAHGRDEWAIGVQGTYYSGPD